MELYSDNYFMNEASFKKMAEMIMAKIGAAVVPIKAMLIAEVVCPAI